MMIYYHLEKKVLKMKRNEVDRSKLSPMMKQYMEVKDKKVILTGAADGIGKELTKQLLNKGAFVYGLDINGEKLAKLKDELNTDRLVTYIVDVSSKDNLINFKEQFIKDNGRVDILINNAAIDLPNLFTNKKFIYFGIQSL